ncbi:hypothetical protein IQ243_26455 [Nostocales cyanobacterium LEGE 11386]|nr:hypothetical protein [Nostocales cyanobacterium LEGE 11386]
MQDELPAFTNVQSFSTKTATYKVGEKIKFWDTTERTWTKGEVIQIIECSGFFVSVSIAYKSHNKQRQAKIFREDWLDKN